MILRARQNGFTLVELMVAMALGVGLLAGLVQIFSANQRSNQLVQVTAEVQEAGRIITELMARDIRMADYWGCGISPDMIFDHLDHTDPDYDEDSNPIGKDGVDGIDNATSVVIDSINVVDGTDVLTMRSALGLDNVKVETPYMNVNAAALHVNKGNDLPKGMILLITDCTGGDLFSNTANNTENSGTISHNTGNNSVTGSVNNVIKNMSQVYNASAQILAPHIYQYFIGVNAEGSNSLYRNLDGNTTELVRHLTDLQFTYGEDTNTDGVADVYAIASAVTDMENVVAIRTQFNVESESLDAGQPFARQYTFTTNIRNRSL